MHQSKVVQLLRALSPGQLRRCQQLLPALLAGKPTEVLALFEELIHFSPKFSEPDLEPQTIATVLKLSTKQLARLQNELLRALENCLLVEKVLKDPVDSQLRLMDVFTELELPKHYQTSLRRVERQLEKYPHYDFELLSWKYKLADQRERTEADFRRSHSERLQTASDDLDRFYLAQKLRYLLEMVNLKQTFNVPYRTELVDLVENASQQALFAEDPLIRLYRMTIRLMEHPEDEQLFFQLREDLSTYGEQLQADILMQLYTYLLNHCTRRITRHRDKTYYEHYLSLNEFLIQQELLLHKGQLAPGRFSNLITVGLRTGRTAWARSFLENYRELLPEEFRENTYLYNLAHCLYYEKDYDSAQRLLNQLELSDLLLAVAAKNLLVKIYYETRQIELLLRLLGNYRVYINYRQPQARTKLRKQVGNFIATVRKMAKLPDYSREERQRIQAELPAPSEVLEHDWLVEQLS